MGALRERFGVPLIGCTFKRPAPLDESAVGGGTPFTAPPSQLDESAVGGSLPAATPPGSHGVSHGVTGGAPRQKNVMHGGRIRRWSVIVFAGGEGTTETTQVVHSPIQALGGGDAWVAGCLHALMEASFHLPSGGGALVDSTGGYTASELASILSSACRRGDLLAALQMRSHGDFSTVSGEELRQTEALVRGQPYQMPSGAGVSSSDAVGLRTQALLGGRGLPLENLPARRLTEGVGTVVGASLPTPLPFSPSKPLDTAPLRALPSAASVHAALDTAPLRALPSAASVHAALDTAPLRALPSAASVHAALHRCGIIPVVTIEDVSHAVPLARALVAGGISVIELTLRTAAGEASIREIASGVPEMLVGAGTVLSTVQAERVVASGAHFLVAPGTNAKVVRWAGARGVVMLPGVATASEVEAAMELGLDHLKFFPAEPLGGLAMLKALSAPYTTITWMPTGGISLANVRATLIACMCSPRRHAFPGHLPRECKGDIDCFGLPRMASPCELASNCDHHQ